MFGSKQGNDINIPRDGFVPDTTTTTTTTTAAAAVNFLTRKGDYGKCVFFLPAKGLIMPDQITVSEFVAETNEDYKSPTASNFTTRMSHCRNTVAALEEVSGFSRIVVYVNTNE